MFSHCLSVASEAPPRTRKGCMQLTSHDKKCHGGETNDFPLCWAFLSTRTQPMGAFRGIARAHTVYVCSSALTASSTRSALQKFPWASPLGTPLGKGVYLSVYPLSRHNTDTVFTSVYKYSYASSTLQYSYASGTLQYSYASGTVQHSYASGTLQYSYANGPDRPISQSTNQAGNQVSDQSGHYAIRQSRNYSIRQLVKSSKISCVLFRNCYSRNKIILPDTI